MKKVKIILALLIASLITFWGCQKIDHQNELPFVLTGDTSNVQLTTATISGSVTPNDAAIQSSGHVWSSVNQLPGYSNNEGRSNSSGAPLQNKIVSNLTNLSGGKIYYVRGYVISGADTVYGNVINFSTIGYKLVSISTGAVTNLTLSSADVAASITSIGNSAVTEHGHVWSKTNQTPTTADSLTTLGALSAPASYTSTLSKLLPGTIYYVRAYATNSAGTQYGNVVILTTVSNNLPAVITGAVSSITTNSSSAAGTITDIGSTPVSQYGHVWSSSNNLPTLNDSKTQIGSANAPLTFNSSLTGLTAGTTYYMRAYAINSGGATYGDVVSFTTSVVNNLPAVSTGAVSNITTTSSSVAGAISDIGSTAITQYGHVWSSTNPTPTIADSKTQLGSANAPISFNSSLNGLTAGTNYYVRAYATNSIGTSYGPVVTFTTATPLNNPPSVTIGNISSISINSGNASGNITDIGSSPVTQYGHVWSSSNATPTVADNKSDLGGTGVVTSFNSSLTGLQPNTLYYVRAYAVNNGGITYSGVISFTTGAAPNNPASVTSDSIRQIIVNAATGYGTITSIGNSPVTQYGHVWSSTNNLPTINDSKTQLGTANAPTSFTSSLTALTAGTTYYVRAYAVNNGGTSYGTVITFITPTPVNNPATVSTGNVSSIAQNSSSIGGSIVDIGSSPVTQYGHVWSSTNNTPTTLDSKTQLGTSNAALNFTSNLSGLQANTIYYVRAYAINSAGTAYGAIITFTTTAASSQPSVTTGSISAGIANTTGNITDIGGSPDSIPSIGNSASAAGNITDIGSSNVTQYGHVWSSTNNIPTTADNKTNLGTTGTPKTYNSSLTGLQPKTTYYVRAYATNSVGTTYGGVVMFTTGSPPNNPPLVTTDSVGQIAANSAIGYGKIADKGSSNVTQYGHVWSSSNTVPTVNDSKSQLGSANAPVNFSSALSGLQKATVYYIRSYAVNNGGISYGNVLTFITGN